MAHFHLAWELGGDPAHAGRLRVLAQALLARGHTASLAVRDLAQARRVLGDLDVALLQAPLWLQASGHNAASLAEIMLASGYHEAQALDSLVRGWRALLELLKPDVLVAEFAPTALLAARSLDIPGVAIGAAFTLPPAGQPLPNFRPWEAVDLARLAQAELHVLKVMNTVLVHYGGVPYLQAADALLGRQHLLCAWPELDHYGRAPEAEEWLGPAFVMPPGEAPQWPPGHGHKVYVYLRQEHPAHVAVLHALVMEGCRVLCYQPEVAAGAVPPVHATSLAWARGPVDMAAALSEARLCVNQAGEGTVTHAMLAAVPMLLLPTQLERYLLAQRLEAAGVAINGGRMPGAVDWRSVVRSLLMDGRTLMAARNAATRYAGFSHGQMAGRLVARLESVVSKS
ncbi:glycosyltransferase [Pseudoduganella sp. OTU4001]|uniref:glycosyltransferase n=1 Tax=Pseudoduganella sp. OTU4001 TaxID=3043854 RepID=UPI00313A95CE